MIYSLILIFNRTGDKLLLRRQQNGNLKFVGGPIREDEFPLAAVHSIIRADCGLSSDEVVLTHIMDTHYYPEKDTMLVYAGRYVKHDSFLLNSEHLEWVTPDEEFFSRTGEADRANIRHILERVNANSEAVLGIAPRPLNIPQTKGARDEAERTVGSNHFKYADNADMLVERWDEPAFKLMYKAVAPPFGRYMETFLSLDAAENRLALKCDGHMYSIAKSTVFEIAEGSVLARMKGVLLYEDGDEPVFFSVEQINEAKPKAAAMRFCAEVKKHEISKERAFRSMSDVKFYTVGTLPDKESGNDFGLQSFENGKGGKSVRLFLTESAAEKYNEENLPVSKYSLKKIAFMLSGLFGIVIEPSQKCCLEFSAQELAELVK